MEGRRGGANGDMECAAGGGILGPGQRCRGSCLVVRGSEPPPANALSLLQGAGHALQAWRHRSKIMLAGRQCTVLLPASPLLPPPTLSPGLAVAEGFQRYVPLS